VWKGQPSGFVNGTTVAINGDYRVRPLDFNADGHEEALLYRSGASFLRRSNTNGFTGTQTAPTLPSTVRPVPGDFTGDIRDDLYAYVPGTGTDHLYRGTSTGLS
jgi:hypothetical protein